MLEKGSYGGNKNALVWDLSYVGEGSPWDSH